MQVVCMRRIARYPPLALLANHKTTAIVLLGSLWPALLMAFTRYSNWVALGWSFGEAFVCTDMPFIIYVFSLIASEKARIRLFGLETGLCAFASWHCSVTKRCELSGNRINRR